MPVVHIFPTNLIRSTRITKGEAKRSQTMGLGIGYRFHGLEAPPGIRSKIIISVEPLAPLGIVFFR